VTSDLVPKWRELIIEWQVDDLLLLLLLL